MQPRRFVHTWLGTLTSLCALLLAMALVPPAVMRAETDPGIHDPSIIKAGDYYYFFSTGDAGSNNELPIQRSRDLINWEFVGAVWNTVPQWLVDEIGRYPDDLWAPDVSFYRGDPSTTADDTYRVYYAISIFGTNRSVIALATNKTLDPASPNYNWVDEGAVIRSTSNDNWNAIDPNLVVTPSGEHWLSWGSFWSGIKMRRLDPASGKLSSTDTTLYGLSERFTNSKAVEGPSIIYRDGYYYLFVAFDFCCRGVDSTYRTMVGRATQVTGPYVDQAGVAMTAGGGTELLRGYDRYRGPGHGYAFFDGPNAYFAHHYYDSLEGGRPRLQMRPISWGANGWPTLGEPLGEQEGGAYVHLINRNSGQCVEVAGAATHNGAPVQQATCATSTNQQWRMEHTGRYYRLVNRHSGKVLEIDSDATADGANVQQGAWLSKPSQEFRFTPTADGWLSIQNRNSAKVLTVAGCSTSDKANVEQRSAQNSPCQEFRVQPVGDIVLANRNSGRALDVVSGATSTLDGANVQQASFAAANLRERWSFIHNDSGFYRVTNRNSGMVLEVALIGTADGANIQQWTWQNNNRQQFRLEPLNDGSFRLVNRDSGKVVEVASCSLNNGANVAQWSWLNNACQRWSLWTVGTTANRAPVAANQQVTTKQDTPKAILLGATDADNNTLVYRVTSQPKHGTLSGDAPNLTYTPVAGYYEVDSFTFVANDGTDGSNVATVSIMVNGAPTVDAGGPYTVTEGSSVGLAATGSDPENDALTYAWDLDGTDTFETTGQSVAFDATGIDGPARRTVGIRVMDANGQTATAKATITITNVAPSVNAVTMPLEPVTLGAAINANASFSDPGTADTHTVIWNWGDGTTSVGSMSEANGEGSTTGSHTYAKPGDYTVQVMVMDDEGSSGSANATARIVYGFSGFAQPVDNAPMVNQANAGQSIPFKWRLTDANGNPVTNLASVTVTAVNRSCTADTMVAPIEEYVPSKAGLQNLGDGNYQYDWTSPRNYAGTCKMLKLDLGEGAGQEHIALFQFK